MPARLGKVIYWIACGLAPIWMVGSAFSLPWPVHDWPLGISEVIAGALLIWGIGRAALYILSGE